jgi:hypothetical protein
MMSREAQATIRGALDASYDAWVGVLDAADRGAIESANQDCRDVATMQGQNAAELGCPL